MNSINENQPENNYQDLNAGEAIDKIKTLAKKAGTCFFCTDIATGRSFPTRPMAVQEVDDAGNLWFLSASDSHVNEEIGRSNAVQLLFQGSSYSDFLNIYGYAEITTDKSKIEELWKPDLKTWFTEGKDDPRITVIKVEPVEGYYWDTKHALPIAFIKRLAGAVLGKTLDDSIEGEIRV